MDSVFNSFNKNNLTNFLGGKKCNEAFRGANILSICEKKEKKVITCPRSRPRLNRDLKQLRRRPQRRLQEKIGLMIKTTALLVHHAF